MRDRGDERIDSKKKKMTIKMIIKMIKRKRK